MSRPNLAEMTVTDSGYESAMKELAADIESLPPATLYLTLSKLLTKGLRLLLDESISVVSDRLNAGDSAASALKTVAPTPAATSEPAPPGLPAETAPATVEPAVNKDSARGSAAGFMDTSGGGQGSNAPSASDSQKRKSRWEKWEDDVALQD